MTTVAIQTDQGKYFSEDEDKHQVQEIRDLQRRLEETSEQLNSFHLCLDLLKDEYTSALESDSPEEDKALEGRVSALTEENKTLSDQVEKRDQTIVQLQRANESMERIFRLQKAIAGVVIGVFSAGLAYAGSLYKINFNSIPEDVFSSKDSPLIF